MSPIPDAISENLEFDISGALQGIGQISDALDQVVQTFQVGLADALSALTGAGADVQPLADTLDVAGLGPAVDTAITDGLASATGTPVSVPIEGDTTSATQAIDSLDATPVTLEVDADTTAAQTALDDLGTSATNASGGTGGGEGIAGLEGAVLGLKAASGGAVGDTGELTGAIGGLSEGLGGVVAGGAAFAAFLGETTKLAADAQAQNQRFAATFGLLAGQVDQIHVGGLNTTIEELGKASGTTDADLKAVASRIGALGQSAGASDATIVKTTDNLLALGATFSVNNPRLGDAASVTDRLTNAFARGGRALAPFGLALSSAQISAEALAETGKTSAADLTLFEKSTAGANLAVRIFGDTLGTKFQQGAQSAQVQFRALKVSLEETLVAVGQPLLAPLVQTFTNLLPIAQEVGRVLGALAGDVLPLVSALSSGLSPVATVLGLVADGLHVIGPGGVAAAAGLSILVPDLVLVAAGFGSATVTATAFGVALDFATGPVGIAVLALSALGVAAHLAGDASKQTATDTAALDHAFAGSGTGAESFTNSIDGLNKSIDDYLGKQLQIQKNGTSGADTLAKLGFTFDDIKRAVGGTTAQYNAFLDRLDKAAAQSKITGAAHDQLFNIVNDGAGALDTAAANSVALAQASGLVTSAQVKAAQAQDPLNGFTDDYGVSLRNNIGVLERLQPIINVNVAAQAAQTRATSDSTGAFAHLSEQIKIGAVTSADAATVATQLGISTADATTFINSQATAFQSQADKALLASAAGKQLTDDLQAGTISVHQAQIGFTQLGVSIPGVTTAVSDAQAAVSAFVDSTLQKLPTVADAFKDATTNSKVNLDTFQTDLQQKIINIGTFVNNLSTLVGEGFGNLAQFLASQGPQVAGQAAAALATDSNRAKILDSTIGLFGGADFAAAIKLKKLFPGLSESAIEQATGGFRGAGAAAGSAFQQGLAQGLNAPGTAGANQTSAGRARLFASATTDATASAKTAAASAGTAAQEGFDSTFHPAASAQDKISGAAAAIRSGGSAAASIAASAGTSITTAFGRTLNFDSTVSGAIHRTPAAFINAAGQVQSVASGAGHDLGVSFGAGLVAGINSETPFIAAAAAKAADAAVKAAKDRIKPGSPSKVTTLLGQQFSQGLALGIVDATPEAVDASTVLANSVVKQLQAALAAATAGSSTAVQTAAQSAFTSFLSTAGSALPSLGSDISRFAQNIVSTTQAQNAAFRDYKKALAGQADDQKQVQDLQTKTGIAYGVLTAAMQHYNDLAASEPKKASAAQKAALQAAKDALSAAQSQFDSFSNKLDSANSKLKDAAKNLKAVEVAFKAATAAQNKANDPATFTQGIRAQNAQANQFAKDIAKLAREGFTDLAKQLADAGPEAAAALARGFAKSPAKAKSAEAAVDAANTFAIQYQAELTKLFGPQGGAASAAQTAGATIGQALTTGLTVASQAGTATALSNLSSQLGAGVPQLLPLVAPQVPQKAIAPIAANAPTVIQTPTLAAVPSSQSLALDLTIVLDDGRTVTAQTTVPFTPPSTRSLKQLVRAQVHAS